MTEEKPYITVTLANKVWNPKYTQDAVCVCGHAYERHFDSYDEMRAIGCKYCACNEFIRATPT